jgi:hypothetical protein
LTPGAGALHNGLALMAPARKPTSLVKQLRSELPRLLRDDVEVRGQVIAILSEYLTTREETAAILAELRQMRADFDARFDAFERRMEEQGKRIEEQGRRIEEQGKRIEEQGKRIEEQGKRIEEQGKRIEDHTRALAALQRQVMGLGARWGLMSEEAFRSGVRSLFADQPNVRVEQWRYRDDAGRLFGYPSDVEVDAVIRDGQHVLVEIKSAVSAHDVAGFARKADLYGDVTGRRPQRRLIISPYVEPRAREAAARLDIEICEGVTPPEL